MNRIKGVIFILGFFSFICISQLGQAEEVFTVINNTEMDYYIEVERKDSIQVVPRVPLGAGKSHVFRAFDDLYIVKVFESSYIPRKKTVIFNLIEEIKVKPGDWCFLSQGKHQIKLWNMIDTDCYVDVMSGKKCIGEKIKLDKGISKQFPIPTTHATVYAYIKDDQNQYTLVNICNTISDQNCFLEVPEDKILVINDFDGPCKIGYRESPKKERTIRSMEKNEKCIIRVKGNELIKIYPEQGGFKNYRYNVDYDGGVIRTKEYDGTVASKARESHQVNNAKASASTNQISLPKEGQSKKSKQYNSLTLKKLYRKSLILFQDEKST